MIHLAAAGRTLSSSFSFLAYGAGLFTACFSMAAVLAARRLWLRRSTTPPDAPLPPVTILKPIKGLDRGMYENLASFLSQDYAVFQVLFCIQSAEDPAHAVLERLLRDFPHADVEVVVSEDSIGLNPKVNNLSNAAPFIKHDLLMISDSDVRVERDFLRRTVAPLSDPSVGMVTCFYLSRGGQGLGGVLEALSINAHFLPQAAAAAALGGMGFAMGAVMLLRRDLFERVGGFESLGRYLADDYRLGRAVLASGKRIALSDSVVSTIPDAWPLKDHFVHILRWSRTLKVCQPLGFTASILLCGGPLLLCWALLGGGRHAALAYLALTLFRASCVAYIHVAYLRNQEILRQLPTLPISDFAQLIVWAAALAGRHVYWRGERFLVMSDGRLVSLRALAPARVPVAAARA